MVLKKRINYHWRLFMPIAFMLCVVFGLIIWYQYKREADYRAEIINKQLDLLDSGVLDAYERDVSLRAFLNFTQQYFKGSMFEGVRLTVYENHGPMLYSLGTPIPLQVESMIKDTSGEYDEDGFRGLGQDLDDGVAPYFYSRVMSPDSAIIVYTAMPYTEKLHDAIDIDSQVWIVIAGCLLLTLFVTYYSTRMLTRSVTLLKDFAYRAATGTRFTGLDKFPRNELGDISREIVTLYRERGNAIELIKKERKVAVRAIEEKARVTRQMTNNINHEIKTPVGIIRGYLESIIADPGMDEATRKRFLERMLANVERLSNLLNDVSTMTRLENGSDKIAVDCVDIHEMVYQIDNDLPANNLAGDMEFTFDIPINCLVTGNYNLISGMICGLIRNAAMHSGGTKIGFRLISESERFYVFSFYDNGSGVGEEHIPHLFERFYRVDTGRSRKAGGTGLGLPIVKSTVMSLGGTISVHNRSVGGLEFIFTLPKWTESTPHDEEEDS